MNKQAPPTPPSRFGQSRPPAPPEKPKPDQGAAPQQELERVRDIILGPDTVRQRLQGSEVSRLREILFGAQMKEYERRLADLKRETERGISDLRLVQDSVSEFEKVQTKRIELLEGETRQANNELRREVDQLRARETVIQQLLTRTQQQEMLGRGLSRKSDELQGALSRQERGLRALGTTVSEHRDQRERKLDVLKHEMRRSEDDLRTELRRIADRLTDQKIDRKALAAMLIEVATRLETGSTVTSLLEKLTPPSKE